MNPERIVVDPHIVAAMREVYEMMRPTTAPDLGIDWCITIETCGRPVAEVRRTMDDGIKMALLPEYEEG